MYKEFWENRKMSIELILGQGQGFRGGLKIAFRVEITFELILECVNKRWPESHEGEILTADGHLAGWHSISGDPQMAICDPSLE